MNVFKEIENKANVDDWQKRCVLLNLLSKIALADAEAEVVSRLKNKTFLENLLQFIYYTNRGVGNCLSDISEALVNKIYKATVEKNYETNVEYFLFLQNINSTILEAIADQTAEAVAGNSGLRWRVPSGLIGHKNFTKALEDKLVASPKRFSFFYETLAEHSNDEKNIVKMAKYINNSWAMRKVVKKKCLSHASLEKMAKVAPEAVAMHSRKLTPQFVDTLALSKNRDTVASAMMNVNIRPETMRKVLEEADETTDYRIIRNVAYNKKATVENLALAFSKAGTGFYNLKDFVKHAGLMTYIQQKLKDSK
jgi:hypothetical protein